MGIFSRAAKVETKDETFDTVSISDWYARNGYKMNELFGSFNSYSGQVVNAILALELSAVYACVKILAEDVGSLPFILHKRSVDGRTVNDATRHRLYPLLRFLPNPSQSSGEFVESLTATAAIEGQSFAMIEGFNRSRAMRLRTLAEDESIRPVRDRKREVFYAYKNGYGSAEKTLTRNQVFHLRGFTFDCVAGDQILRRARHIIGNGRATQKFASTFLKNDVSSGLFFEHPGPLGDEGIEGVLNAWKEKMGPENAGLPAVLQEGMKANRLDPDLQKQQLLETRKFIIEECARLWRMPLHKLAHLDRMSFNNVEQISLDYLTTTLAPWQRRWKEAVYRHLFTRQEQLEGLLFAEHKTEAMLRGDFKTQTEGFRAMLEKGVYSINEVRRWLNMNPVKDGDQHFVQLNMASIAEHAAAIADIANGGSGSASRKFNIRDLGEELERELSQ